MAGVLGGVCAKKTGTAVWGLLAASALFLELFCVENYFLEGLKRRKSSGEIFLPRYVKWVSVKFERISEPSENVVNFTPSAMSRRSSINSY